MAAFDRRNNVQRKKAPESAAPQSSHAPTGPGVQLKATNYLQQKESLSPSRDSYALQRREASPGAEGGMDAGGMQATAAEGIAGSGQQLPHLDTIQAAFGGHDVSGVDAHVGGAAADASHDMGAQAYATGNSVAFAESPDLHTAAHEAAHVVQQREGVQLKGGVGEAGDSYEQNADAVADRVVAGQSAADLLPGGEGAQSAASGQVQHKPVQLLGDPLNQPTSEENRPAESHDYHHQNEETGEWVNNPRPGEKYNQRAYSFGKYQEMWERERGRKMTEGELATLRRGCIGITVLNLGGSGNPPLGESYNTFDQGHARMQAVQKLINEHPNMTAMDAQAAGYSLNFTGKLGDYKAVMFAKLFWSNQKAKPNQADFNAGEHEWSEDHKWEKQPLMLPNGMTVEQMIKDKGRQATIDYVHNDLGMEEFKKLTDANHDANVKAYYLAWAKAMEKKDPDAFPVDESTGKVDMTGYLYQSRPKIKRKDGEETYNGGYVNFDYGFYDEATDTIWHANHMMYKKGDEKRDKQPMYVYQSTVEKFTKGYTDFDRVIFCVGLQKNYDPNAAAANH